MTKSEFLTTIDKAVSGDGSQAKTIWHWCHKLEEVARESGETSQETELYQLGNRWMLLTGDLDNVTPAMQNVVRESVKEETISAVGGIFQHVFKWDNALSTDDDDDDDLRKH